MNVKRDIDKMRFIDYVWTCLVIATLGAMIYSMSTGIFAIGQLSHIQRSAKKKYFKYADNRV